MLKSIGRVRLPMDFFYFYVVLINAFKYGILLLSLAFFWIGCTDSYNHLENLSFFNTEKTSLAYFDWKNVPAKRITSFSQNSEFETFKIGSDESDSLFLDIYGCSDIHCFSAMSIVLRSKDYEYAVALKKGEFKFSEPTKKINTKEFGENCELRVASYWNLKVDASQIKLDWTMLEAEETCEVKLYK
jgi:hypothetical protein